MGIEKIGKILKHKRIIITSLILLGFVVMISMMYILTFINNKPVIFGSKDNKLSKSSKYFDFTVLCDKITYKNGNATGSISCQGVIYNLDEDIKNVEVQFELHSNWTNTSDYTSSTTYKVNSGKVIKATSTTQYLTDKAASLKLNCEYPKRVLPFVKIKNPTIYAKVTYTRVKPTSLSESDRTETLYFAIPFSEYCSSHTIIK